MHGEMDMAKMTQLERIERTLRVMLEHMDDVNGESGSFSEDLTHIGAGIFRAGFYSHTLYMIGADGKLMVWFDAYDFGEMKGKDVRIYEDVDAFVTEQTKIIEDILAA